MTDQPAQGPADPGGQASIESCLLGVTSWWLDKHNRAEVMGLVSRHFRPQEVYEANKLLSSICQLGDPIHHRNSALRSAGEAFVVDLVNNLEMLDSEKRAPRYLVPSTMLDRIPLSALSVRNEVSVGARLESLEQTMSKVSGMLERLKPGSTSSESMVMSRMNSLEESVMRISSLLESGQLTQAPSFRTLPNRALPSVMITAAGGVGGELAEDVAGGAQRVNDCDGKATYSAITSKSTLQPHRIRSRSTSLKRKAEEQLEKDQRRIYTPEQNGFPHDNPVVGQGRHGGGTGSERAHDLADAGGEGQYSRQGRPRTRKLASGTSQVKVDEVADYVAPVEYYIGNTSNRTTEDDIKTVLTKCAAPVPGGENLIVEKVELLTKELNPRTKCWKVVIPYKFKEIMDKDEVYPSGWKHRKFFGSRNAKDKKSTEENQNSPGDQVLREREREVEILVKKQEEERQALQVLTQKQKEEECRLLHEAERLRLLEERMTGSGGGTRPGGVQASL